MTIGAADRGSRVAVVTGATAGVGRATARAWLAGIIVNLLTFDPPRYFDIAARDFAIMPAALTLNRLAVAFDASTVVQEARHLKAAA